MSEHTWEATVFAGLSVDGFIARLDDDITWLENLPQAPHSPAQPNPDVPDFDSLLAAADHMVMGRSTFQKVVDMGFWPYTPLQVIVLSTSLSDRQPHGVLLARSLAEAVGLLDARGAQHVYVDGGRTVQSFLAAGLITNVVVNHVPVLIGTGLPLFGALPEDLHLSHLATAVSSSGMVSSSYRVLH
ncbi:dihydrofolate reductase family protein [Kocuria sp.]|uniref:dihydrofolate reductase family protein n=1 Tax=Kocuria sp. TaxID=1871328 RepID=UPI0026E02C0D|nr:dihydrofolate reductase family protein [Kocuria sp.]MDO5619014.1 dihydrofolate reductase family protein [Kocuria sp.]